MSSIIDALKSATQDDLNAVGQRIAELEAEASALRIIQRALLARLGQAPAKAPRPAANRSEGVDRCKGAMERYRTQTAIYLSKHGPAREETIHQAAGVPLTGPAALRRVLACDWFVNSAQGWHITPAGRQAVC